ncbi:hypothetical protein L6164_029978 [Bauhinia variegata]|uniref:Uncharacterized protein n=1 Tax=Bauhinia variegata TaxID=167791 RepID=A0ACB9LAZ3_BAUVA|nr:hypothetical protein L6164_029978 [Bauhinia variegata]
MDLNFGKFSNNTSCNFLYFSDFFRHFVRCADDKPFMPTYQISKEKAKSLGIEFTPLDVTLKETVESLRENKFIDS